MSDAIYTVKIVAQGYNKATIARIAALFKKPDAQIEAALALGDIAAKKNIDQASAEQLKHVIEERTGAECIIVPPVEAIDDSIEVIKPAATKAHPPSTTIEPTSIVNRYSIITLLCLILIALSGGYYYYQTTTAAYSIVQIQRAVAEKDLELFEKHVDYKGMILASAKAMAAIDIAEASSSSDSRDNADRNADVQFSEKAISATTERLALALEDSVLQGGELPISSGQTLSAIAATLREIQLEGKPTVAHATINYPRFENKAFELVFGLRKMARHWEIFELQNLAELFDWQAEQEAYYLFQANQRVLERITASISQVEFDYKIIPATPFLGPELRITMSLVNTSEKTIKTIYCNIEVVRADNGQIVATQYFSWGNGKKQLTAGETARIIKDIPSRASPKLKALLRKPNPALKFNYEISSISFADGSELIPYQSFADIP